MLVSAQFYVASPRWRTMCWCRTCRAREGRWSRACNTQSFISTLLGYGSLKGNHNCINSSMWMQALKNHELPCKFSKCNLDMRVMHFWIVLQKWLLQGGRFIYFEKHPPLQPELRMQSGRYLSQLLEVYLGESHLGGGLAQGPMTSKQKVQQDGFWAKNPSRRRHMHQCAVMQQRQFFVDAQMVLAEG